MRNLLKKFNAVLIVITMITSSIVSIDINSVKAADSVLTSPEISVVGYQIKTNVAPRQGVSFRTVCKAPDIGSIITVDGKEYTITNLGTIYTKDINTSGDNANNILDKSYTELNVTPYPQYMVDAYGFKYTGQKEYLNSIVTYGYVATDKGITDKKDGYTSYVRTMTGMDAYVRHTLFVRAFVEAVDEQGNDVIIYGEKASVASVAQIAYQVYIQSKAPNVEGHKYIFDNILNKLLETSPYYMETELEYGWSESVTP